jgi:hypothetical protein
MGGCGGRGPPPPGTFWGKIFKRKGLGLDLLSFEGNALILLGLEVRSSGQRA